MMKKIISILPFLVPFSFAADYNVIYFLNKPDINFVNYSSEVLPPTYGEWENFGDVFNCTSWSPSKNTISNGTTFDQNRNCQQLQKRTVSNSDITEESRNINVSETQKSTGTLTCNVFNISGSSMITYGSVNNSNGTMENPNFGTRMSWNGSLIYSDLNQTLKEDRTEIVVGSFVYRRQSFVASRNITFEGYNYKSYDHAVCRYPLE